MTEKESEEVEREIVVPGETIVSGKDYLPGDGTKRINEDIIAIRFGLSTIEDRTVKVISVSGVYIPRRNNVVIGKVIDITYNGWIIDINSAYQAFLPLSEIKKFVSKFDMQSYLNFGDMVVAMIKSAKSRGVDLTMKEKGLHKLEGGMILNVNPSKVPRIIGKKGSMISMIKEGTNTTITIGQNGLVWIRSENIENELFAREVIIKVIENSSTKGLTEKIREFLEKNKKEQEKAL